MFISEDILKEYGYGLHSTVHSLTSLPSSDCNYKKPLKEATDEELRICLELFERFPKNNASRRTAVLKELKAREKESDLFSINLADFFI